MKDRDKMKNNAKSIQVAYFWNKKDETKIDMIMTRDQVLVPEENFIKSVKKMIRQVKKISILVDPTLASIRKEPGDIIKEVLTIMGGYDETSKDTRTNLVGKKSGSGPVHNFEAKTSKGGSTVRKGKRGKAVS